MKLKLVFTYNTRNMRLIAEYSPFIKHSYIYSKNYANQIETLV